MKCDSCQHIEATIIFTSVAGDEKMTLHLCPACAAKEADKQARESQPESPAVDQHASAPQPPTGIGGKVKKVSVVVGHLSPSGAKGGPRCPQCGTSYEEFRKLGRFGCATCYEAFAPHLERLFKRIHGAQVHTGKRPARPAQPRDIGEELSQLRQKLREAVAAEAYERAGALRDRITSIEAEVSE